VIILILVTKRTTRQKVNSEFNKEELDMNLHADSRALLQIYYLSSIALALHYIALCFALHVNISYRVSKKTLWKFNRLSCVYVAISHR
jgi:hypothetical protein